MESYNTILAREAYPLARKRNQPYLIAFVAVMAAAAFVSNYLSIPVGSSRVHLGNIIALLSGMLFGGPLGALAAGLGSGIFDIVYGFIDPVSGGAIPPMLEALVTFANKGLMAFACGVIVNDRKNTLSRAVIAYAGAVAGASLYVTLFLLKTLFYSLAFTPSTLNVYVLSRLATSTVNAAIAIVVSPLLYRLLRPALESAGLYQHLDANLLDWPGRKAARG